MIKHTVIAIIISSTEKPLCDVLGITIIVSGILANVKLPAI